MEVRDTRGWADRERDELHRLLIYIRGVEHEPNFSEEMKDEMTHRQYIRVVQLNSPLDTGQHRLAS